MKNNDRNNKKILADGNHDLSSIDIYTSNKGNLTNNKITQNYFCSICGSVMTTKENKKYHDLWEFDRKNEDLDIL